MAIPAYVVVAGAEHFATREVARDDCGELRGRGDASLCAVCGAFFPGVEIPVGIDHESGGRYRTDLASELCPHFAAGDIDKITRFASLCELVKCALVAPWFCEEGYWRRGDDGSFLVLNRLDGGRRSRLCWSIRCGYRGAR